MINPFLFFNPLSSFKTALMLCLLSPLCVLELFAYWFIALPESLYTREEHVEAR